MNAPHFHVKNRFQKRVVRYEELLTNEILSDICFKLTGQIEYTVDFDNGQTPGDYNRGHMGTLTYLETTHYITFSQFGRVQGRNSYFQSVNSAFVRYLNDPAVNKTINYYFLEQIGNIETRYFKLFYRIMRTVGIVFLNAENYLEQPVVPFVSIEDLLRQKEENRAKNRANASTYATISNENVLQIFAKTYGASKYESGMLCLAMVEVTELPVELYEVEEGGLTQLPQILRSALLAHGVELITSDIVIDRDEEAYEENDSLRSPTYIYNLLEKLGEKKCSFCNCEIPQIIQGAHIWPVASIKRAEGRSREEKLESAIHKDNGLWLCNNHHKMFDINMLYIASDGQLKHRTTIQTEHLVYLKITTLNRNIPDDVLTEDFLDFLNRRNLELSEEDYSSMRT